MLCDIGARLLFSVFNHTCIYADGAHQIFRELVRKIDYTSDGDKEVTFDEQFADVEDLSVVNKCVLISLARCVSNDDVELHPKLRQDISALAQWKAGSIGASRLDILQSVVLMEVLFPVKFSMFSIENNLMEMMVSDPFIFATYYSDKVGSLMQPVILTVTIMSSTHIHTTVVNTKSGIGTFNKDKDELSNWLIASVSQYDNLDEGTVHAIIKDWKDGLN